MIKSAKLYAEIKIICFAEVQLRMELLCLPVPTVVTDRCGTILQRSKIKENTRAFAVGRNLKNALGTEDKKRFSKLSEGSGCEVFCFTLAKRKYAAYIYSDYDSLIWIFPPSLMRNMIIPWKDFSGRGVSNCFVRGFYAVLNKPTIALPELLEYAVQGTKIGMCEAQEVAPEEFERVAEGALRLMFGRDVLELTVRQSCDMYEIDRVGIMRSLGRLAMMIAKEPQEVTARIEIHRDTAFFTLSGDNACRVKIGRVTRPAITSVGAIRPYCYDFRTTATATALANVSDLCAKFALLKDQAT